MLAVKQVLNLFPEEAGGGTTVSPDFNRQEFLESLSGISNSTDIQLLKRQKIEIESQVKELSSRYLQDYPALKELSEKLSFIEKPASERKIAWIGRFTGPKGERAQEFIEKTAPELLTKFPDLFIEVIGGNPQLLGNQTLDRVFALQEKYKNTYVQLQVTKEKLK